MLELSVGRIRVSLSFTFFAAVAAVTLWNGSWGLKIVTALICCILHELGHISAMCMFGIPPERVFFYAGGIKISPHRGRLISKKQDMIILFAGCSVNLFIALLWRILSGGLNYFACANLFLGIFNLMPVKYFDGGRLLSLALNESRVCDFIRGFFLIFLSAVLIKMLLSGNVSISLMITFVYIAFAEFMGREQGEV